MVPALLNSLIAEYDCSILARFYAGNQEPKAAAFNRDRSRPK
jgi:hypothetical protein